MIVWYVNDIVDWREYRDVGNVNVCECVMNENASGTYYESPVYTLPAKNDFRDGTKRRNKKKKALPRCPTTSNGRGKPRTTVHKEQRK